MAWWIFQNVVITTALAAAVAMLGRSGRIGPVAKHALWVIILLKFVTPPIVLWPWAAPDPLGLAAIDSRIDASSVVEAMIVRTESTDAIAGDDAGSRGGTDGQAAERGAAPGRAGVSPWPWIIGIWAAGSLFVLGVEGTRLVRVARRIRLSRGATSDFAIADRVAALSARLGLRPVPVAVVTGTASPAVWGFGRPRLLWPATLPADVTDACLDGLIVHELAHVKRGDHLVGWIELAAGIVWWWNPLFWFVRSSLREQAELACDAWVISALPNGRRAYAESLLALSSAAFSGQSSMSSMAVVGIRATSRRVLERRLVMIMKGRAPLRLPFVGLFCLALVAVATLPAWATSQQAPPPPPPPVPVASQTPPAPPAPPAPRPKPAQSTQQTQPVKVARPTTFPTVHVTTPEPSQVHIVQEPAQKTHIEIQRFVPGTRLPEDGQKLVQGYEAGRDAIQKEVDLKIAAARDAVIKDLEKLQDQYTKAGKLDEAVAIRDYLRAGGPAGAFSTGFIRKIVR